VAKSHTLFNMLKTIKGDLVKYCPACKQDKDISSFYKSNRTKDGFRSYCIECERIRNSAREPQYKLQRKRYRQQQKFKDLKKAYYNKNKEMIDKSNKEWRKTLKGRYFSYKRGAISRKLSWNLDLLLFESYWGKPCSYCGDEIETIGLDRIINSIGYEPDNIIPCCTTCNRMKMNMNKDVFLRHISKITKHINI
jgi:hypothetical protein